jgi:hypothetical protein
VSILHVMVHSEIFCQVFETLSTFGKIPGGGGGSDRRLYLHRTSQHKKTRINTHTSSWIRTHDTSVPVTKAWALDFAVTVIGIRINLPVVNTYQKGKISFVGYMEYFQRYGKTITIFKYTIYKTQPKKSMCRNGIFGSRKIYWTRKLNAAFSSLKVL